MPIHFEELWEKCEQFHNETSSSDSQVSIIEEIAMKLDLYKTLVNRVDMLPEEKEKLKSFAIGEVLLSLTALSLKDNINTFEALQNALTYKSIGFYNTKYSI